jgi:hypothetical protein
MPSNPRSVKGPPKWLSSSTLERGNQIGCLFLSGAKRGRVRPTFFFLVVRLSLELVDEARSRQPWR